MKIMMRLFVTVFLAAAGTGCTLARSEGFESPAGTDQEWSDGAAVTPGNSVDPNASTVAFGSPTGWGAECGRVTVGNTVDGGALWRHRFSPGSTRGFLTSVDIAVDYEGLEHGQAISFAVMKPAGGPEDPVVAWALYFARYGDEKFFMWTVGNFDQIYRYPAIGSFELDRRYLHEIAYDLVHDVYGWRVDGQPVAVGIIPPTYFQNLGTFVLGSSESSTGRNSSYCLDNFLVGELDPP